MAFGSGVLIAALAFSLIEESFSLAQSIPPVIFGFVAGGLSYTIANYFLNKKSSGNLRKRKRPMVKMQVVARMHQAWHY
jgi:zinc transporter, ZIP family